MIENVRDMGLGSMIRHRFALMRNGVKSLREGWFLLILGTVDVQSRCTDLENMVLFTIIISQEMTNVRQYYAFRKLEIRDGFIGRVYDLKT